MLSSWSLTQSGMTDLRSPFVYKIISFSQWRLLLTCWKRKLFMLLRKWQSIGLHFHFCVRVCVCVHTHMRACVWGLCLCACAYVWVGVHALCVWEKGGKEERKCKWMLNCHLHVCTHTHTHTLHVDGQLPPTQKISLGTNFRGQASPWKLNPRKFVHMKN